MLKLERLDVRLHRDFLHLALACATHGCRTVMHHAVMSCAVMHCAVMCGVPACGYLGDCSLNVEELQGIIYSLLVFLKFVRIVRKCHAVLGCNFMHHRKLSNHLYYWISKIMARINMSYVMRINLFSLRVITSEYTSITTLYRPLKVCRPVD